MMMMMMLKLKEPLIVAYFFFTYFFLRSFSYSHHHSISGRMKSGERKCVVSWFLFCAHRPDTSDFSVGTILRPVGVLLPLNGGRPWRNHYLTDLHITSCYQSVCVI